MYTHTYVYIYIYILSRSQGHDLGHGDAQGHGHAPHDKLCGGRIYIYIYYTYSLCFVRCIAQALLYTIEYRCVAPNVLA